VDKCKEASPIAIAPLKAAVLNLFDSGDDGGNQPHEPTPDPDDSEFELLCLNGETGDCLTTDDLTDADIEADTSIKLTYSQAIKNRCGACWGYEVKSKTDIKAGFVNRANLNFMEAVNLERTGKEFYQTVEAYLDRLYYNGQACEWASPLASPLCSLVWEDAPLLGQYCEAVVNADNENEGTAGSSVPCLNCGADLNNEANYPEYVAAALAGICRSCEAEVIKAERTALPDIAKPPSTKMVHLSANCGYLKLEADGRILSTYAWFSRKAIAQAWMQQIEVIPAASVEMRASLRNPSWQWELKIKGLSMAQVERLSKEALYQKPTKETPAQVAGIEPPCGWGKPQIAPSSKLFVEVLLADSEYYGQILPVSRVSANEIGYTVSLPNGDSQWFRADVVQVKDALPADPIEEKLESSQFKAGDIVNWKGCKLRVVEVGLEKLHCVLRSDSEGTKPHTLVPIAECSLIEESPYLSTTGNYAGLSKQVRQHWEKVGINPSDLIADMKANRPPEPEWNARKYNPVLAAVGADDASDF
jgi:hypothetical protein